MSPIAAVVSPHLPPVTTRGAGNTAGTCLPCLPDPTDSAVTGGDPTPSGYLGKALILALALAGAAAGCHQPPTPTPRASTSGPVASLPATREEFTRLQRQLTTQGESTGSGRYRLRTEGPAGETRVIQGEFGRSYRHVDYIVTFSEVQPTTDGFWVAPSERMLEIEYTEYLSGHGEIVGGMVKNVSSTSGEARGYPRQHVTTAVDAHGVLVRVTDAPLSERQLEWLEQIGIQP